MHTQKELQLILECYEMECEMNAENIQYESELILRNIVLHISNLSDLKLI